MQEARTPYMKEHSENTGERTRERTTAVHHCMSSRACRTGLAVEGPGFLVWDEVASVARKRAAELSAVAPWQIRSVTPSS